jgi:hypothetical protein
MSRARASTPVCLAFFSVLAAAVTSPASAQVRTGVQGGVSIDPDQVFFGGHIETTPLIDRLRFRPNLDIGLGDSSTLFAFNLDFTYTFPAKRPWSLYAGAGPAINWYDFDDGSNTEGGFNFIVGAKHTEGMFFEIKIGAMDTPDFKFGVGYTFR